MKTSIGRSNKKMGMMRFALAMLALQSMGTKDHPQLEAMPNSIALGSYGGNPEAGNYFRTKRPGFKKTNRLTLSRKAKIKRRRLIA